MIFHISSYSRKHNIQYNIRITVLITSKPYRTPLAPLFENNVELTRLMLVHRSVADTPLPDPTRVGIRAQAWKGTVLRDEYLLPTIPTLPANKRNR